MIVADSIFIAWINYMGGAQTIHEILALLFVFTMVYTVFKITT